MAREILRFLEMETTVPRNCTSLKYRDLVDSTQYCGVSYEDRAFRYAMKGIGMEPSRTAVNETTGKGRIKFYDGLAPLVFVSGVKSARGRTPKSLGRPLDAFRKLATDRLGDGDTAAVERLAGYLFIASPDWGMDVPVLASVIDAYRVNTKGSLLDLVGEDGDLLRRVLTAYQELRSEWERTFPLFDGETEDVQLKTRDVFARKVCDMVLASWGVAAEPAPSRVPAKTPSAELEQEPFSIADFFEDEDLLGPYGPADDTEPPVSR